MRHTRSLTTALLLLFASPALAEWPATGIVVNDSHYSRLPGSIRMVPDGAGGVLVHSHNWFETSRVDPGGAILWTTNPFTAARVPNPILNNLISYDCVADGSGGMWYATLDSSRNLVAVHLDATGALEGDVVLLRDDLTGEPYVRAAVPDGAGGMFVVWEQPDAGAVWQPPYLVDVKIRATRVDAAGNVIGPTGGALVFGGPGKRSFGGAVPDGTGGLLVMTPEAGTTVQRLDAALAPRWGAGAIVSAPGVTGAFDLAATGDGGAFVAWPEGSGASAPIKVQRLDAAGRVTRGWPADGATAAVAVRDLREVRVIADGTGGACVAWRELRFDRGYREGEVRVSRVLSNGQIAHGWRPSGVAAGAGLEPSITSRSVLAADGTGGCYLAWPDVRFSDGHVYAQHLTADGRTHPGWPAEGLRMYSEFPEKSRAEALSDGAGGVYVAWDMSLPASQTRKVRLTRLSPGGFEGGPPPPRPSLSLARVAPNPATGLFSVSATMPDERPARLEVFDLAGRVSQVREIRGAGEQGLTLDSSVLATGVHWMRLTHATGVRTARIVVLH